MAKSFIKSPPPKADPMPFTLTTFLRQSIAMQREVENAAATGMKESIFHAAMMNPHTAAEFTLN